MGVDAETRAAPPASGVEASRPSLPERLVTRVRRAGRLGWQAIGRGVVEFYNSDNLTFAASIAYYALLSLFPFILLLLTLVSSLAVGLGDNAIEHAISRALPQQFKFLTEQMQTLSQAPVQFNVLGLILTVWGAMGVFGAITSAVNHAWGVEKDLGFFKHKLVAMVMMLCAGLLLLATLALTTALEVVKARWFEGAISNYPSLLVINEFLYRNAPTPLFIFAVGLVYYFAPNAKVRLRDVWVGAIVAGLLWRLAFSGFSLLVRETRLTTIHGSIVTVVIFLIWVYMSAVIFLYGCEVTAAYARLRKQLPQSAPAAPARDA